MPRRAQKPAQRNEGKEHPTIGRDGRTIAERIEEAMQLRRMSEAELIRRSNEIGGEKPDGRPLVTQQSVSNIRLGNTKASRLVPILAEALDVRAVWLQWGIGERTDNRIAIPELIESLQKARRG